MKTNTQHTPGPWQRLYEDKLPSQTKAIVTENASFGGVGEVIAWSNNYCGKASEANARLIASAPELLAALQQCADFILKVMDDPNLSDEESLSLLTDARNDARAAITKATGGQS